MDPSRIAPHASLGKGNQDEPSGGLVNTRPLLARPLAWGPRCSISRMGESVCLGWARVGRALERRGASDPRESEPHDVGCLGLDVVHGDYQDANLFFDADRVSGGWLYLHGKERARRFIPHAPFVRFAEAWQNAIA